MRQLASSLCCHLSGRGAQRLREISVKTRSANVIIIAEDTFFNLNLMHTCLGNLATYILGNSKDRSFCMYSNSQNHFPMF